MLLRQEFYFTGKIKNMQAIRQILNVNSHLLKIHLPDDFTANKVEVIILPMDEYPVKRNKTASLRGKLNLTNEQYNDFQADVKNSREGWGKVI